MRTSNVAMALSSLALSVVVGCAAAPGDDADESGQGNSEQPSASEAQQVDSPQVDKETRARIAESTLKLERAFSDQFVRGAIDRQALSGPIHDAVASFPEGARPEVQEHIDAVIDHGAQVASRMTPDERAEMAQPPEKLDQSQQDLIGAWGWPGRLGWGGVGAFGFPAWRGGGWGMWGRPGWGGAWGMPRVGWGGGWGRGWGGWGRRW